MQWFKGIKRRWLINNLGPVIIILLAMVVIFCMSATNYYYSGMAEQIKSKVIGNANFFNRYVSSSYDDFYSAAKRFTGDFVDKDKIEMQVVGPGGEIMFTSSGFVTGYKPGTGDVVETAASRNTVVFVGNDTMTDERVMSASAPLMYSDGTLAGVLRFITSTKKVDQHILQTGIIAVVVALMVFGFVLFSNYYFIRSIVNPIKEINEIAKKIAAGSYDVRINHAFNDEIGELADTINCMSAEIGRTEKLKNDFIASVSHELRTPLTAVTGWAETLADGGMREPDLAKRGLAVIVREAENLRNMLEELLDFSRMQSGRLSMSFSKTNLGNEIEDVLFTFEERLRQENMTHTFTNEAENVWLNADRARLRQVFVNIVDNARKHAKDGHKIDVTLHEVTINGQTMFEALFRDYGSGIPSEDIPHVKEKFYKGRSRQPGSGIGLAVSNEIVGQHGGYIDVRNAPDGHGAEIAVVLPQTAITEEFD